MEILSSFFLMSSDKLSTTSVQSFKSVFFFFNKKVKFNRLCRFPGGVHFDAGDVRVHVRGRSHDSRVAAQEPARPARQAGRLCRLHRSLLHSPTAAAAR